MKRYRILFLCPVTYFKGGAERSLLDLLANPHIDPVLAVPADGEISAWAKGAGIECLILNYRSIANIQRPFRFVAASRAISDWIKSARDLTRICAEQNIDLVHSNGLKAHFVNVLASKMGGPPAIVHLRDIANTRSEKAAWRILQVLADRLVLVSRATWPNCQLPSNATVIHNGFAIKDHQYNMNSDGPLRLGFVGRIHPFKGLHILVDWLAHALRHDFDGNLVVRGSFAEETPDYRASIIREISRHGISDRISFEGYISDPDRVYENLDVVVVPSKTPEPLARAVMEAMGRGLTVIAWPSGGSSEMISTDSVGFLVTDADDFRRVVLGLQDDRSLLRTIGEAAKAHCRDNFSIAALHRKITDTYTEVLRKGF